MYIAPSSDHSLLTAVRMLHFSKDLWKFIQIHQIQIMALTLKRLGGGLKGPPSTFRAITLQRVKLSSRHFMTFFFQVSRTVWHQICDARGYGSEVP